MKTTKYPIQERKMPSTRRDILLQTESDFARQLHHTTSRRKHHLLLSDSEVNLMELYAEKISIEKVLVILTKPEKRLYISKGDDYIQIDSPVLIKIPKKCEIWAEINRDAHGIELTKGKPFILPKIEINDIPSSQNYN